MKKKIIILLLQLLCLMLPVMRLDVYAETLVVSGTCGESVIWALDNEGVLTISGNGAMDDYAYGYQTPWSQYASDIKQITVQPGVTRIGSCAFATSGGFTGVTLPDGLVSIGTGALTYSHGLVDIPASVTLIEKNGARLRISEKNLHYSSDENGCLYNKNKTVLLNFPDNFHSSYVMPDSVERIEAGILTNYSSGPSSVTLSSRVSDLGDFLENYYNRISVPSENPYFSNDAYGCVYDKAKTVLLHIPRYDVQYYVMPDTVERIEYNVISGSSNLRSITLSPVTSGLGNLLEYYYYPIHVPAVNPYYSSDDLGALYNKERSGLYRFPQNVTGAYTVPDTVIHIFESAFRGSALETILLPEGLESISAYAFASCKVEKLEIPASVENIGYYALQSLQRIAFLGDVPNMGYNAFQFLHYKGCTVYYDGTNTTWTEAVRYSYDSKIVWIPFDPVNSLSGKCGANLTYSINKDLETITITGNGKMDHWDGVDTYAPWIYYGDLIRVAYVGEDVSYVDGNAFLRTDVKGIHFAGDAPEIGENILSMTLNIYYPADADGWNELISRYADGNITWICEGTVEADLQTIMDNYENMTAQQIRAAVQSLDRDALLEAMRSGEILSDIADLSRAVGHYPELVISSDLPGMRHVNTTMSTPMGLGLNDFLNEDSSMRVLLGKSENPIPVPDGYAQEHAVQFHMTIENVKHPENLAIPAAMSMDLDEIGNLFFFDVFWRDPNSGEITKIADTVSWSKIGTCLQFVITGEGDYALIPLNEDATFSGSCGDNLTWTYSWDSTLNITGSGCMDDYHFQTNPAPWDYYRENITQIVIGDQVEGIGSYAFYDCRFTYNLDIPESVRRIGSGALSGLYHMQALVFHGDAPVIEEDAFLDLQGNAYYHAEKNGWEDVIQSSYGASDYNFSWISLPYSGNCGECVAWSYDKNTAVLTISGNGVMDDYGSLADVTPWNGFISQIKKVVIDNGVSRIGAYAFSSCYQLSEIEIPDSVTEILEGALYLGNMESFTVPAGVTNLSLDSGIREAKQLLVDPDNTAYCAVDNVLFSKDMKKLLLCTSAATGDYIVPEGVTTVGAYAFMTNEGLTRITFPTSLEQIESGGLYGCYGLKEIIFLGNAPIVDEYAMSDTKAEAWYPADNTTWTEDVLQNYGGSISWIAKDHIHVFKNTMVSGNCTEEGYTLYECQTCDYTYKDNYTVIITTNHDYEKSVHTSTCWELGYTEYTCQRCGDSYTDNYSEGKHDFVETVYEASCHNPGYTEHKCKVCEYVYHDNYSDGKHDYKATVVQPTCMENGYTEYSCADCNDSYRDQFVKGGHKNWEEITHPATCEEAGYTEFVCKDCGDSYNGNYTAPLRHNFTREFFPFTETDDGFVRYTCECGFTYDSGLNNQESCDHTYETDVLEPDCWNPGRTEYRCKHCGDSYEEYFKDPVHDYEVTLIDPDCWNPGCTEYRCKYCGDFYEEYLEDPVHDYEVTVIDPDCWNPGCTEYCCKRCGDFYTEGYKEPVHNYVIRVEDATCTEPGFQYKFCTICSSENYPDAYIEPLGHSYEKKILEGCTEYTCRICGDFYHDFVGDPDCKHDYIERGFAATCTQEGYTAYECRNCSSSYITNRIRKDHDYIKTVHEPMGADAGYTSYLCRDCGYHYKLDGKNCQHDFQKLVYEPVGDQDGYTRYICKQCYMSYQDGVLKHTHDYVKIVHEANCYEMGRTEYFCRDCGFRYTTNHTPVKHDYTKSEVEATCTERGYIQYFCQDCTHMYRSSYIERLPHDLSPWQSPSGAEGVAYRYCSGCNYFESNKTEEEEIISGSCGENATWSFVVESGRLTISGIGEMTRYYSETAPWYPYIQEITSVYIEEGITNVSADAFWQARNLTEVVLPDTLAHIDQGAFSFCTGLKNIRIPGSVKTIEDHAFWLCEFRSITLPNGISSIISAFDGCYDLTDVYYCGTEAEWHNITGCDTLMDGVRVHFEKTDNISGVCGNDLSWELDAATGVLTISGTGDMDGYFYNGEASTAPWAEFTEQIVQVIVEQNVTSIGQYAFVKCNALTSVVLPDTVTSIGKLAFAHCEALPSVTLPIGVEVLGANAFLNCSSLREVNLSQNVKHIYDFAFSMCPITELILPASIESIGSSAFSRCEDLSKIIFVGNAPAIAEDAFLKVNTTAYYPNGDTSWTDDICQNYGGTIAWVPYSNADGDTPEDSTEYSPELKWFFDKLEDPDNTLWATGYYAKIMEQYGDSK